MKIKWWQGGVHVHPETDEERQALLVFTKSLGFVVNRFDNTPSGPPSGDGTHQ